MLLANVNDFKLFIPIGISGSGEERCMAPPAFAPMQFVKEEVSISTVKGCVKEFSSMHDP